MTRKTETLVIGGGAIGICCAHYLTDLGRDVLLVERDGICSGSSYGNAGLIVPSYSIPMAAPGVIGQGLKWMFKPESPFYIKPRLDMKLLAWLWRFQGACSQQHVRRSIPVLHDLHTESLKLFDDLASIDGMDFALEKKGLLELFNTHRGIDEGHEDIQLLKEYGIENRFLEKSDFDEFLAGFPTAAVGGVYLQQDAHLIPDRFVRQLARHTEKSGARIQTSCEVLDFKTKGRRVTGVTTTRGSIKADEIVVAGGSWSTHLAGCLKLSLSMQPAKGYSITFRRPSACPPLPLALAEARVVLTPMADAWRFAGTLELAGFDQSVNLRRVAAILKAVRNYFPDVDPDSFELLEIWRGLRPCSPDGLPYIGRAPGYDNVIIATGHGMLGISLAPITGLIVSQLSANQKPSLNMNLLRVNRFD